MMKRYEHSTIITDRKRKQVNKLINQYVTPNSRIKEKVRVFYDRHLAGFNLLGVHVRGTDHWMETPEQKLPPLLSWVNKAAEILETLPHPRKVFIASDNDEVIELFVEFFGKEKVAFIDAFRAKRYHSQIPPHGIKFSTDSNARALGTQVLMDILLLARCEHFLHAESSVALLASYFNPNMRSYFLDPDKRSLKVNSPNKHNDNHSFLVSWTLWCEATKIFWTKSMVSHGSQPYYFLQWLEQLGSFQ
ncbi:PREDICTED: uncharacterized protein LOC107336784 [Acropora digitifera]|uniref:uncharacterized protein LOC107336784 n=1 Tax=Acropora digitifera TaxID=70779 RepID=UPI00077AEAC4|nr:PREDICTED: uncharacterized protein LOC107336784 [Acropora digitifera]